MEGSLATSPSGFSIPLPSPIGDIVSPSGTICSSSTTASTPHSMAPWSLSHTLPSDTGRITVREKVGRSSWVQGVAAEGVLGHSGLVPWPRACRHWDQRGHKVSFLPGLGSVLLPPPSYPSQHPIPRPPSLLLPRDHHREGSSWQQTVLAKESQETVMGG